MNNCLICNSDKFILTFRTVSEDQTVITPHFICGVCVGKILKAHFGNNAQKCLELIEKKDEKALEELVKVYSRLTLAFRSVRKKVTKK